LFVFVLFVFLLPLVANKDVHYRILVTGDSNLIFLQFWCRATGMNPYLYFTTASSTLWKLLSVT